jgi:alpha-glucuronidase
MIPSNNVPQTVITSPKLSNLADTPGRFLRGTLERCFDEQIDLTTGEATKDTIWIGYLDEAKNRFPEITVSTHDEGYVIKPVKVKDGSALVITSPSKLGLLYASARLNVEIKVYETHWSKIDLVSNPEFDFRNIWFWSRPELHRGFFNVAEMTKPRQHEKFLELGRLLINMKANAMTFWGRTGEGNTQDDLAISGALGEFARFLKEDYGIKLFVFATYEISERFGFDINREDLAGNKGSLLCVHNPVVRRYWQNKIDLLYERIPDLGGLLVAGAGGDWIRGPWECNCEECQKHTHRELIIQAINMIAAPLAEHGGTLIYKDVTDRPTLVSKEVELFANLEGLIPDNVIIAFKNHYKDFRPPHPYNPMFYSINPSGISEFLPYLTEFQIFGEYRGSRHFPAIMTEHWSPQFILSKEKQVNGVMAVASSAEKYLDHPLNMANWYSFGELSWNPNKSPDDILREWAILEFGKEAAPYVIEIAKISLKASMKMMFTKGIVSQNHSNLPSINYELESSFCGPWHDIPRTPEGMVGRGHDMSAYPPDIAKKYRDDPNMLFFTSRVPLSRALVDECINDKEEAIQLVRKMIELWEKTKDFLPKEQFEAIRKGLSRNLVDAHLFKESLALYLEYKLGELTRAELRSRLDHIKSKFRREDGSPLSTGTLYDRFIEEWEQIYNGTFKRRIMEGEHYAPPTSHFPPGLKE